MKKILLALLLLAVLGGAAVGGFFYLREVRVTEFAATPYGSDAEKIVEIKAGTGKAIARQLAEADVVANADDLYLYMKRVDLGAKMKAGEYAFQGKLTPPQVLDKIVRGDVRLYRFTVPEGLRVDEILPIVAASPLKLNLEKLQALAKSKAFLKKVGVPADSIEGFLFPDTYSFAKGANEEAVLTRMVQAALAAYRQAAAQRGPGINFDLLQAFTLASIVEKETGAVEERPRIACVFHNRLKNPAFGKLQTDPTVIYAMMLMTGHYDKNIRRKDLETDHPYNTYTRKGLPPGPIASPGLAALKAALNPLVCADYFFVSRNDGTHVFCPTLACHEAEVQKWQIEYFRKKRQNN